MPMPSIGELNVGKLCAFLDQTWDLRKEVRKHLEQKVPILQARAKHTNQILCELLRSLAPECGLPIALSSHGCSSHQGWGSSPPVIKHVRNRGVCKKRWSGEPR